MDCGLVMSLDRVERGLEMTKDMISTPVMEDSVVEHYERAIHQLSSQLHPYNYLMIDVKQKLAMLYGNIPQYKMVDMSRPAKHRKIQLCMGVMDCLSKVRTVMYKRILK